MAALSLGFSASIAHLAATLCAATDIGARQLPVQLKHRPSQLWSGFHAKSLLGPSLDLTDKQVAKMQAAAEAFNEVGGWVDGGRGACSASWAGCPLPTSTPRRCTPAAAWLPGCLLPAASAATWCCSGACWPMNVAAAAAATPPPQAWRTGQVKAVHDMLSPGAHTINPIFGETKGSREEWEEMVKDVFKVGGWVGGCL